MAMKPLDKMAYNLFGDRARVAKSLPKLDEDLRKAQMPVRAEAYLAKCWFFGILTGIVFLLLAVVMMTALTITGKAPTLYWIFVPIAPMVGGAIAYVVLQSTPGSNAKKRGKDINRRL